MATLTVTGTQDFSHALLLSINSIVFDTPVSSAPNFIAGFESDQFGDQLLGLFSGISNTVTITGDAHADIVKVSLSAPGFFSASGWKFTNWDAAFDVVSLVGTGGNDTIVGSKQADTIFSAGGVDQLFGGAGSDTFIYGASGPAGTANGGGGFDSIGTGVGGLHYDFAAVSLVDVEGFLFTNANCTVDLTGDQIGAGAITFVKVVGSGNRLNVSGDHVDLSGVIFADKPDFVLTIDGEQTVANALTGSARNDIINGGQLGDVLIGGAGADALNGGGGEDVAVYASSAFAVTVNLAAGNGAGGDAAGDTLVGIEDVVGSIFSDVLTGNAGANQLIGGFGDDQLTGGAGADVLDGTAGQNAARYDASTGAINVNLATGTASGGDAQGDVLFNIQNLVGTAFADILTGNASANSLFGGGGNDILTGGAGSDLFVFNSALDAVNNIDALPDFQAGIDQFVLDHAVFVGLPAGVLAAAAFAVGTAAADAGDRIVYDQANGLLFFDPDGNGSATAVHFANVQAGVPLTNTDFIVV
jgi:Ca2+-binding RTX toxin-like protein